MPQPLNKTLRALFDIKPVDDSGWVDVARIYNVQPVVNLGNPLTRLRVNQKPAEKAGVWNNNESQSGTQKPNLDSELSIANEGIGHNSDLSSAKSGRDPASHRSPPTAAHDMLRHANFSRKQSSLLASSDEKNLRPQDPLIVKKLISQDELEKYLNSRINVKRELKAVGASVEKGSPDAKPRYRPILSSKQQQDNYQAILSKINQRTLLETEELFIGEPREIYPFEFINDFDRVPWPAKARPGDHSETSPADLRSREVPAVPSLVKGFVKAQPEIESWVKYVNNQSPITNSQSIFKLRIPKFKIKLPRLNLKKLTAVAVVGFSVLIFTSLGQYGISVKKEVLKESNSAVANLEEAKESLITFNFETASSNFAEAYEEFSKAGDSLNFMGASLTSIFAGSLDKLGINKLKSAKNLVEAGKLLAEAGRSMSEAVSSLSQTGAVLRLNLNTNKKSNLFGDLKKSLISSSKNLSKAGALLFDVSPDLLPEDKRDVFSEFKSKLPEMEKLVSDAVKYADFLEDFLSPNGTKKYLVLFQNSSELRPTGGFPGTYAVATFKNGRLDGFLVDDVYNLDGQLKENVIPPNQLQHITPNWGMRDANWFIDFSVSAQKTMEFFNKEAGYEVDGVITVSPRTISDILKVVGPIEMPKYNTVIDAENFVSAVQAEVEYGDNRQQPKQIVVDMAPLLLEKIYSADAGRWMEIFNVFVAGLDKKDVLMYFKDLNLESFVAEKEFGGLVNNTTGDYLMVVFSNIKGSKTDRVTDNAIKLDLQPATYLPTGQAGNLQPIMKHKLTITRQHNGGNTKYGFYNKQNPAYVRVLVPEGSKFVSISGNSNPQFKPLIDYSKADFKIDGELFDFESTFEASGESGVDIYKESGRIGFAFWMVTDPNAKKTVELEYSVPLEEGKEKVGIYIQKQPGLDVDNFELKVGGSYIYNGEFDKDLNLKLLIDN